MLTHAVTLILLHTIDLLIKKKKQKQHLTDIQFSPSKVQKYQITHHIGRFERCRDAVAFTPRPGNVRKNRQDVLFII